MDLVTGRNVEEAVGFLKKELVKTHDQEYEKNTEYRQLLIQSIHSCAIKFPNVASNVVHVLMEFIADSSNASAVDVIAFVREVMEKFPQLRVGIIQRLIESFGEIKAGRVFRGALWIIGEYALDIDGIDSAFRAIRQSIGEVPMLAAEERALEEKNEVVASDAKAGSPTAPQPARRVLADGTYATESAFVSRTAGTTKADDKKQKQPLRGEFAAHENRLFPPVFLTRRTALILNGDFFLGSVLATTLTKLVLRFAELMGNTPHANALRAEAMLIMTSIVRIGRSEFVSSPIDEDSSDRIQLCLRTLGTIGGDGMLRTVFLEDTRKAFSQLVAAEEDKAAKKKAADKKAAEVQVDDVITFRQLKSKRALADGTDEYDIDLTRATGVSDRGDDYISKLNRVVQLTGFSDPVYAEAYVNVHQYDILLDVLIVNQTAETLQNLTLEFSTLGDLKLVERPAPYTVPPRGFHSIKANIKVSSTETGVIFGNIVYDGPGALDTTCVILNDIHIGRFLF